MSAATGTPSPDDGSVTPGGSTEGGNDGPDVGSYGLSTGAIVGICVAVGAVILGIAVMWCLWFLAKKRGWEVRKSISRMSRRVTGRFEGARSRRASAVGPKNIRLDSRSPPRSHGRDLEKGGAGVRAVAVFPGKEQDRRMAPAPSRPNNGGTYPVASRPPPSASVGAVQSKFDAETPVVKSFREKYMKRPGGA